MNVTTHVDGAPYQVRDIVEVSDAIDREIHDVSRYIGMRGIVSHLNYDYPEDGEAFPDDPLVGVLFEDGSIEEFWPEELKHWPPKQGYTHAN